MPTDRMTVEDAVRGADSAAPNVSPAASAHSTYPARGAEDDFYKHHGCPAGAPTAVIAGATTPPGPSAASGEVVIGEHRIGPHRPCFLVAEAGVNHNGSLRTALALVDAAANAGADAVKFQMFRAAELATAAAPTALYQHHATQDRFQRDMLARLELSLDDFAAIRTYCDQRGILFLATPFSPLDAARLTGLGAPGVKIASTDLMNKPLLRAALSTGRPIILSTGAAPAEEVRAGTEFLVSNGARGRLILLHCVSAYPTPIEHINLGAMRTLREMFQLPVGLSDHTLSTDVGGWAVAAGACLLEKHLTLDAAQEGPDHALSLTPDQYARYAAQARLAQQAIGGGRVGLTPEQADVRGAATKSVVAAVDISEGETLTASMLTAKRPGGGISPWETDRLIGRMARKAIRSDTVLSWDMLR